MSLDETIAWYRELERAIGHAIAAHGDHWKTEKDVVRFHDRKTPYAVHPIWCAAIIDIQVSVRTLQPLEAYSGRLESLGYVHLPHQDDSFAPFFYRPAVWPHTHHVHVVESGGEEERKTLAFRDYLREHAQIAREYEDLKRGLAPRYSSLDFSSRQAYADAKSEFIAAVTRRATAEGYPRDLIS